MTLEYLNLPSRELEQEIVMHLENVSYGPSYSHQQILKYEYGRQSGVMVRAHLPLSQLHLRNPPLDLVHSEEGTGYQSHEEGPEDHPTWLPL